MRILTSFHYYREVDLQDLSDSFPEPPEIFADSGAFSAHTQQSPVSVSEYADWIDRWEHLFSCYANLDVIHNDEASLANLRELERRGYRPLPVFHGGEPWEQLEAYCRDYTYVCLGGMVGSNSQAIFGWLVKAFQIAAEHGTVLHGFGQTRQRILTTLPWYSVDSTTWGTGHRYGIVSLWDNDRARFVKVRLGNHGNVYQHAKLVREHDTDPAELATPGFALAKGRPQEVFRAERVRLMAVNVKAWLRFEGYLRRRHGPIGPPAGYETEGPKIYLADSRPLSTERVGDQDLAIFARGAGPRVYLAEGNEDNMRMLGTASREGG